MWSGVSPRSRQSPRQGSSWSPISKHRPRPRLCQRSTRCCSPPPPGGPAVPGRNRIVSRWQLRPRCLQRQTGRSCWRWRESMWKQFAPFIPPNNGLVKSTWLQKQLSCRRPTPPQSDHHRVTKEVGLANSTSNPISKIESSRF